MVYYHIYRMQAHTNCVAIKKWISRTVGAGHLKQNSCRLSNKRKNHESPVLPANLINARKIRTFNQRSQLPGQIRRKAKPKMILNKHFVSKSVANFWENVYLDNDKSVGLICQKYREGEEWSKTSNPCPHGNHSWKIDEAVSWIKSLLIFYSHVW